MAIQTRAEINAQVAVIHLLNEEGYPTYAKLFRKFRLHLTADPDVVGYMIPDKGEIVLNRTLRENQISLIVRHEILHEYLQHSARILQKLGATSYNINDYFDGREDEETGHKYSLQDLKDINYDSTTANIAGDMEISNRGYTEEDKDTARNIEINGVKVSGLVTEDHNPAWVDYSVEELYDAVCAERTEAMEKIRKQMEEDEKKKHKGQKPEEIDPPKNDNKADEPQKYTDDTYDVIWVYGKYDEDSGQFFDDDGEPFEYEDTYVESLEEAVHKLSEENLGSVYQYCDRGTGNVYRKVNGSYVLVGNIHDEQPPQPPRPPKDPEEPPKPKPNQINPPQPKKPEPPKEPPREPGKEPGKDGEDKGEKEKGEKTDKEEPEEDGGEGESDGYDYVEGEFIDDTTFLDYSTGEMIKL